VLAACVEGIYGIELSAALRLPARLTATALDGMRPRANISSDWLSLPAEELSSRLGRIGRPDILKCISALPLSHRTLYDGRSFRKTCNALANHVRQRALYLTSLPAAELWNIYLAYFPFWTSVPGSYESCFRDVLYREYGSAVAVGIATEGSIFKFSSKMNVAQSAANKVIRRERKALAAAVATREREDRVRNWPVVTSMDVVYPCLNAYMAGSQWTVPPVCAVCSQYDRDVQLFPLEDDLSLLHLDLLSVEDEFIVRKCIVQGMSACFTFGHKSLDGLMLEKRGIVFDDGSKPVSLGVCATCRSSLKQKKLPALSLANNLFRGTLPEQFQDLTWVEEKVCAIYCITAHVTRLFHSSDPSHPRVFHGNTCAHNMNTVSVASVLPRTPADVNGFLSVVFIGPNKFNPSKAGALFRVRKRKIWMFLVWLKEHNIWYRDIELNLSCANLYPEDGILPGLLDRVVEDREQDRERVFLTETAGFTAHPAELLVDEPDESETTLMVEKMGVSDPECDGVPGRVFVASALRNLISKSGTEQLPDLIIRHEGSAVPEYNNPSFFPGMYPTLFPYGIGGFENRARPTPLSFDRQAKYCLSIVDRSFRYHHSFIFVVLNIMQRRQAHLQTHFTVKKSNFESVARELTSVSAGVLRSLAERLEVETSVSSLTTAERSALNLLRRVNTMSARIPGSQASKIFVRNEIRNYFGYFGLPHVFFTFNPSAVHSPIFQVMYGDISVDLSERFPDMPGGSERALRLARDPVAAAEFFQFSFECLFRFLLGWDFTLGRSDDNGGILGRIRSFYGTTEFTERANLHGHFLIWLEGGLNPSDLHERLRHDADFQERFFAYFEDVIHHHVPEIEEEVDPTFEPRVQRPPAPPCGPDDSSRALQDWDVTFKTEIKRCGEALQRHTCRAVCHKYGNDDRCRFLFPHEVVDVSHFDPNTNAVVFKCGDPNVNYFNPYVLVFCRHNHDMKCILSGKAAKAAMFYISDYITKMDLKTYEVLTLLSRAVARIPDVQAGSNGAGSAKTLLHKCLSQFTRQQQIHAQQAVRYIQGFGDSISSHVTVPMLSSLLLAYVRERHRAVLKPVEIEPENDHEPEDEALEDVHLRIATDREGRVVESNQVHHYVFRGDSLSDMSFYDFSRCIRIERKGPSSDTGIPRRLGAYRRHSLTAAHPLWQSHELVEHTNLSRGDGYRELVPRVVGMSIPRSSDMRAWPLFALAHFKPFSATVPLLNDEQDAEQVFRSYAFGQTARQIMLNWEAVHECEDERDAERLAKQVRSMRDVKPSDSPAELERDDANDGEELSLDMKQRSSRGAEQQFRLQQLIMLMQQSGWLKTQLAAPLPQPACSLTDLNRNLEASFKLEGTELESGPLSKKQIQEWKDEIKRQEADLAATRRNALNPGQQISEVADSGGSESGRAFDGVRLYCAGADVEPSVEDSPRTRSLSGVASICMKRHSPEEVVAEVGTEFTLNAKQLIAFQIVANYFIRKFVYKTLSEDGTSSPLIMLMTGPGGTGKTHVVKAVQVLMQHYGCGHLIRFLAPTGSAASLIDGMTIHKALNIQIRSNDNKEGRNRSLRECSDNYSVFIGVKTRTHLREEWKNVEFLLIDEVSLLSLQLLAEIDHALRFAKEKTDLWFGGVAMIFCGDFLQFPPVGGTPLYVPIPLYAGQTNAEILRRLGRLAWRTINTVIDLTEQQRMKGDPEYGEAVNRLRRRDCTDEDVDLFNSRLVRSASNPGGIDMSCAVNVNATAIVMTNETREMLNLHKAVAVSGGEQRLTICAAHDKSSRELSPLERRYLLQLNVTAIKSSQALPGQLALFEGMPVVLRVRNLSTELGVTNGSQGFIRKIYTSTISEGFVYTPCVLVEFPDSRVRLKNLPKGYFPILPSSWKFTTTVERDGKEEKLRITRYQVPIQPGFAITAHSAQGKTLPRVIASLHEGGFGAYVIASRAKNRNDLCITQPVSKHQLNKQIPLDLLNEVRRLEAIEHNTLVRHGFSLDSSIPVPDPECERRLVAPQLSIRFPGSSECGSSLTKRKRQMEDVPEQTRVRRATPFSQELPCAGEQTDVRLTTPCIGSAGCRWSSVDWSCAYDSVFMILFYVFRSAPPSWRLRWDEDGEKRNKLTSFFNVLTASDSNLNSPELFDSFRDEMRDDLTADSPAVFPRFGARMTSVSAILEHFFPSCEREMQCLEPGGAHRVLNEPLPCLCFPADVTGSKPPTATTLQCWLDDWIQSLSDRLRARSLHDHSVQQSRIVLSHTPPILFFEVPLGPENSLSPELHLEIACQQGTGVYTLAGIVYFDHQHFSTRLFTDVQVWDYDGQQNQGRPQRAAGCSFPDATLRLYIPQGRTPHIYIYYLREVEGSGVD